MDDTAPDVYANLRADLLRTIDQSARGFYSPQIRTLMGHFGFNANQRVRQSSLAEVTRLLADWGVAHSFPSGTGSMDTIRLFRAPTDLPPSQSSSAPSLPTAEGEPLAETPAAERVSPLHFAFVFGDAVDDERSHALCEDAMGAIWQSKPTLFFVEAPEEFFTLLGGYVGALMRRRELTVRNWAEDGVSAPILLGPDELRDITLTSQVFPRDGAVYLVKDVPNDLSDDERVAFIRETFVPHTYRVRARFASTSAPAVGGSRAVDAAGMRDTVAWLAAFAGIPHSHSVGLHDGVVDLCSLLAEATQLRDSLMQRAAWDRSDDALRAGAESSEHVVLKNLVAKHLRQRFPDATLHVEQSQELRRLAPGNSEEEEPDDDDAPRGRARPDVRSVGRVTVEVETLRGLAPRGSSPFVALEQKLRRKLSAYTDSELWLVVPNDLALLAEPHLQSLADSLAAGRPRLRVRLAVMDLHRGEPAFIASRPRAKLEPSLRGASWREARRVETAQPITWNDVAGYSDLKQRLQRGVVDPLRDPGKYARYGVGAANGVLLYGLPGCGKSYVGRVLASEAGLVSRCISPSDLNGPYLGESTSKIRDLFDWAVKQHSCLLILDEIDAVAPQRREHEMHTDEKRAVNELLTQLDRISGKPIVVVGTTNYFQGIDTAVRRSGRFDVRIPVFPPREADRKAIFDYYLSPAKLRGIEGLGGIDTVALAAATPLFSPVDIRAVVASVCRDAVQTAPADDVPVITELTLRRAIRQTPRSIQVGDALRWVEEAEAQLGPTDDAVKWLREEISRVE